jgi:aspartyl-tRNA(Asn)/glutamyl-tRNA(Gln) amidotransferase subunit B
MQDRKNAKEPGRHYDSVVSIEIHLQLNTCSKLFCRCEAAYGGEPNSRVCPVCLGLPGSLPVLNEKAAQYAIRTALALDCTISYHSTFDRKNYFYPDLPRSYQITQHYLPIATGGKLEFETVSGPGTVEIERVHIEEDAGKIIYAGETGESLIDFNRCGIPLLEIVTEPWVTTPEDVHAYLRAIKQLFQYIEISNCDMEKGNLRCDTNISVMPRGAKQWGIRTEIKNLNSFRAVQRALEYEKRRQIEIIESGGRVALETLLWDEAAGKTLPQRSKEEAHDYRYFPEPDLPPLTLTTEWIDRIRSRMPELPTARRKRFINQYHLPAHDAAVLTSGRALADFYEQAVQHYANPKSISNWVMGELLRELRERGATIETLDIKPAHLAELAELVESGAITNLTAKRVLSITLDTGKAPSVIVREKGLAQKSDENELRKWVEEAIAENPAAVEDYRGGKKTAAQFIVGQVMKKSRGQANPKLLLPMVEEILNSH